LVLVGWTSFARQTEKDCSQIERANERALRAAWWPLVEKNSHCLAVIFSLNKKAEK